jgi:hypothetical protein
MYRRYISMLSAGLKRSTGHKRPTGLKRIRGRTKKGRGKRVTPKSKKTKKSKKSKKSKSSTRTRARSRKRIRTGRTGRTGKKGGARDLETTCSICMVDFASGPGSGPGPGSGSGSGTVITNCHHKFHRKCLRAWCAVRKGGETKCPVCRSNVDRTCAQLVPWDNSNVFHLLTEFNNKLLRSAVSDETTRAVASDLYRIVSDPRFDVNVRPNAKYSDGGVLNTLADLDNGEFTRLDLFGDSIEHMLSDKRINVHPFVIEQAKYNAERGDSFLLSVLEKHGEIHGETPYPLP